MMSFEIELNCHSQSQSFHWSPGQALKSLSFELFDGRFIEPMSKYKLLGANGHRGSSSLRGELRWGHPRCVGS